VERIDDYEIEGLLGTGAFGSVYAAHHVKTPGVRLAIKVLHEGLARDGEVARRFFQEALVLARLEHPQIPKIVAFGPWQGTYYLAQERVDGAPLEVPAGGLGVEQAEGLIEQVLSALAYAHQRGVVHRDLKPQNLLLGADGSVHVLDFGLAGIVQAPGAGDGGVGTVGWSAPEQLRGQEADGRADLFSAGQLLHFLLTGRPPVVVDDLAAYVAWAEGGDRGSLRRLRPDVPERLERVFFGLTAPSPGGRFASAGEALGALRERPAGAVGQLIDGGTARMTVRALLDREAFDEADDPLCSLLLSVELSPGGKAPAFEVFADVFLVLDVSGSMNTPDKYPLLRQALAEFLRRMAPRDRVGLAVFSHGAEVVAKLTVGAEAARGADALVRAMDKSKYMFGNATHLAPGLALAREQLLSARGARGADPVRRVYVLTDGALHDTTACAEELKKYADAGLEVHVYGFGTGFNGAALKELVADQRGGSVKPICNEQDVIETFAHIAEVNHRLLGQEGALVVEFSSEVDAGDGWLFRPQERYLGPVRRRRFARDLGGVEAGRSYAALFELRLPPAEAEACTEVARVSLSMRQGAHPVELSARVTARRQPGGHGAPVVEVTQAQAILAPLRDAGDREAERRAARARLDLAVAEKRDPGLISALEKRLDVLEGRASEGSLNRADQQYLDSDASSMAFSYNR